MAFDPSQFGAIPVSNFDPSKFGAVPVGGATTTPTTISNNGGGFPKTDPTHNDFLQKITNSILSPAGQQKVGEAGAAGINQSIEAVKGMGQSKNILQLFENSAKLGAGIVGTIASPLAVPLSPVTAAIKSIGNKIGSSPTVQKFANSKAGQITSRATEDVSNLDTIAGAVAGSKGAMGLKEPVTNFVNKVTESGPPPPLDAVKVTDLYNRAIRPTVVGKNTAGQVAKTNSQVLSGLQSIAENKPSLKFTDANGEVIAGQAPKSVDQLAQAIQQTKSSIFKQYDALAKQAGKKGVMVDTADIAAELEPVINSKSLAIANPRAIDYATKLQERLVDTGEIDAQTTQDVIQHYNEALKAFYRNPNYETASTASIDALVANKFREALDEKISSATGEEYQTLKNQYGALASMEKDVTHRNIVWGRQNSVGLVSNLANIASGVELVKALMHTDPTAFAAGTAIKGIQRWMQYLNNPDVGVSKIFSHIEKSSPAATKTTIPPTLPKQK